MNKLDDFQEISQDKAWLIFVWINSSDCIEKWTEMQISKIKSRWVCISIERRIVQKCVGKDEDWKDLFVDIPDSIIKWEETHYYLMSNVSEDDKYSLDYRNCTWVIMTWIDRISWKNISFMTHQDPKFFLKHKSIFKNDLKQKIDEIIEKSKPWSIDVVLFWWSEWYDLEFEEYEKGVKLLDKIITN